MLTARLLPLVVLVLGAIGVDTFGSKALHLGSKSKHHGVSRISIRIFSSEDISDEAINGEKIRAAVYQAPVQNVLPNNPLAKLMQITDSLRVAANHGVDLVVYPELYLSDSKDAMDRESQELSIISNICGELGVACTIGYAEKMGLAEAKSSGDVSDDKTVYNAIAAFNADGSRAGNYRSISSSESFLEGQPFVESIPIRLQLPSRQDGKEREIRVGLMCGADSLIPEHSRQLVRNGAKTLLASGSFKNVDIDQRTIDYIIPSRAMENCVPLFFANPEGKDPNRVDGIEYIGSSAIIDSYGDYFARGPSEEDGDLPLDVGYLLPCDIGSLHAADVVIDCLSQSTIKKQSIDQWDLSPKVPSVSGKKETVPSKGFAKPNTKDRKA